MAKRRGHGEGSIYKGTDGRWVAMLDLGYQGGRRRRKAFYAETRREVQEKLTAALRDRQQGLPVVTERQTVSQFLERWLEDSARPSIRPATYESYRKLVGLHILPALGRLALQKLTAQHLQGFMNEKRKAGLSPRTVQYLHAVLRRALGQAVKWGLVARNVATLVDPPRVRRPEIRPLSPEQARQFLDSVKGHRLEALYTVALALGLRQGEALGLRWEDVDLEVGTLTVRQALQRIGGKLIFVEPKTDRSRRTIALPDLALAALRAHRSRQLQERLLAGARWRETGLVFTSTVGTPLEARNVTRDFQKLLERAGLPHQRFHDLRHACASLLLAQGLHPRIVMETLGHSQISLTMDTYSHVMPALQREAADLMNAILTGRK